LRKKKETLANNNDGIGKPFYLFLILWNPTIVLELWLQSLASIYYTDYHVCFQLKMLTFEQTIEGLWQFTVHRILISLEALKVCKLLAHNCSLMLAKSQVTFTAANYSTEQFSARQSTQRSHEDILKVQNDLKTVLKIYEINTQEIYLI
jgi:hypothetical protein